MNRKHLNDLIARYPLSVLYVAACVAAVVLVALWEYR